LESALASRRIDNRANDKSQKSLPVEEREFRGIPRSKNARLESEWPRVLLSPSRGKLLIFADIAIDLSILPMRVIATGAEASMDERV